MSNKFLLLLRLGVKAGLVLTLLMFAQSAYSQQRTLSGTVLDESDQPIPGANVILKGTTNGTTTDADGNYSIQISSDQDVLVFSFVGYKSQEIPVGAKTRLEVSLQSDVNTLSEVVVTGYQTERKKDLTGAVSVVDIDDMNKQAVANPMKALQGQVPGVYVTGNGSPRGAATVRIRGIGTLNNNDPLYVIDGVPSESALHTLNPADIESMQVLKDASAATIYGSRAANGVIIITTKKGKPGKTNVTANAYTAFSNYTTRVPMLDTQGYGTALWQAYVNNNLDPNSTSLPFDFDWHTDAQTGRPVLDGITTPEFIDAEQTMRTANTDWFDEISRTGVIQNYDVSVSGASEKGSHLLGIGYFDNKGVIKHTGFNRLSVRLNSDHKLFGGIARIGENLNLIKLDEFGTPRINEAIQAVPMIPVRTADGSGWGGPSPGMNDRHNPVRLLDNEKQNNNEYFRLFGNFFADATIIKGLTLRTSFGIDYGNSHERASRLRYQSGYLSGPINRLQSTQWHSVKTTWTNTLNYNYVQDNHRLDVIGGMEHFVDRYTSFWASREEFVVENDEFMYLESGTGLKDNAGTGSKYALLSYFGKANYSFRDRYLVSATLRYDGSSRFGRNNRFATFPAFSVGWRLSEEQFAQNLTDIIDDVKLRFGWGMTGNQDIDNNGIYNIYLADYTLTSYDINGNDSGVLPSGYRQSQIGNPNLRWEATTMSNWGIDFSFFNQKIYGSAEYYIKTTEDILVAPPYIAVLGEGGRQWLNGASMRNSGFELSLGHRSEINQALNLDLSANVDVFRNEVTVLPDEVVNTYGGDARTGQTILGRTLGSHFGYIADGIFQNAEEVAAHAAQPGKNIGRIRYRDINGDGTVDDYDREWIGVPLPDYTFGFNAALEFKGFDASFFLQGVMGIDINNEVKRWTDFWSVTNAGSNKGSRLLDAWSPENTGSSIPAISLTDTNSESRFSTYYVEDGSYIKLRNAQIGYTFRNLINRKVGIKSLRIYVGGDNLALLYKSKSFTGLDPESAAYGYPNPLVVTTGIQMNLQ